MFEKKGVRALLASAVLAPFLGSCASMSPQAQERISLSERGAIMGRFLAQRYGYCPLDVIGTEQNGQIFEDPELPIFLENNVPERHIRSYLMGRGYGCRSELARLQNVLTPDESSDTVPEVE